MSETNETCGTLLLCWNLTRLEILPIAYVGSSSWEIFPMIWWCLVLLENRIFCCFLLFYFFSILFVLYFPAFLEISVICCFPTKAISSCLYPYSLDFFYCSFSLWQDWQCVRLRLLNVLQFIEVELYENFETLPGKVHFQWLLNLQLFFWL